MPRYQTSPPVRQRFEPCLTLRPRLIKNGQLSAPNYFTNGGRNYLQLTTILADIAEFPPDYGMGSSSEGAFTKGISSLENTGTDDIGRLLLQLNFDQNRYKVFRGGASSLPRASAQKSAESTALIPPSSAAGKIAKNVNDPSPREAAVPFSPEPSAAALTDGPEVPQQQEWTVLESLFNLSAFQGAGRSPGKRTDPSELPGAALFGVCGGVGVTTIVSALGRIWAKSGQRVLLVDTSSPSLLPLYFGAQSPRSDIATFVSTGQSQEAPIYISCGNTDESVRTLASEIDRFYVDGGLFRSAEEAPVYGGRGTLLLVLVPDTRCLVELNRLERQGMELPYLLLNQFDAAQPLHREIQYRLAKQFNDRLLPMTISYDQDVSVALAQGTTIIDYSPSSSLTEDLYKVNAWLIAKSVKSPKLELVPAGQRV